MIGPRSSERDPRDRGVAEERPDPLRWSRSRASRGRGRPARRRSSSVARPGAAAACSHTGRRRARGSQQRRALPGARDRPGARRSRGGRPADRRRRAGRARRGRLCGVGGPRHPRARADGPGRPGGLLQADRELPRLSGRDRRRRAHQPGRHAGAEVRRPDRDALRCRRSRNRRRPPRRPRRGGQRDRRARCRDRHRRRSTGACPSNASPSSRGSASSTPPARRRPGAAAAAASAWSAAATRPRQAAIWLARGGALVTLLHRRAELSETMSDYLIRDLDRYGVAGARSERDRRAARKRRRARGGHAQGRRAARLLEPVPVPRRGPLHRVGSAMPSRATSTASS